MTSERPDSWRTPERFEKRFRPTPESIEMQFELLRDCGRVFFPKARKDEALALISYCNDKGLGGWFDGLAGWRTEAAELDETAFAGCFVLLRPLRFSEWELWFIS